MTRTDDAERRPRAVGLALALLVIASGLMLLFVPAAGAQSSNISNVSPYYANQSSSVDNASWYDGVGNATIDSMGRMATRLGPYFIGTGELDPSGTGFQGVLLTGIVMSIMFVGSWAMLPLGSVGGGVLSVIVGYGMTELGLAPQWFRVILVFAIGALVYVSYLQAQEGR